MPSEALEARMDRLVETIRGYASTVVAFSGGVDSAVVAKAAQVALGPWAVAATSDSPTMARSELEQAFKTADAIGIRLYALERNELDDPKFAENPFNRCYFCKKGLQEDLVEFAKSCDAKTIAYGVNLDDLAEWRPGIEAARELGARFPLADAGFTKQDVRDAAKAWGLAVWDKPASPCLASRIPYGEEVTEDKLARVERAEGILRQLGFTDCRVRHAESVARLEVPAAEVARLFSFEPVLESWMRELGFSGIKIDPRGLKSGRLNEEYLEAQADGGKG